MYAFARDSGIPKRWFDHVDKRTQAPIRTVWLAVFLAFVLALPSLGSAVAFTAVTSIATMCVLPLPSSVSSRLAGSPHTAVADALHSPQRTLHLLRHPHRHRGLRPAAVPHAARPFPPRRGEPTRRPDRDGLRRLHHGRLLPSHCQPRCAKTHSVAHGRATGARRGGPSADLLNPAICVPSPLSIRTFPSLRRPSST